MPYPIEETRIVFAGAAQVGYLGMEFAGGLERLLQQRIGAPALSGGAPTAGQEEQRGR
jgi:hypothetical protein